ncbi:TIGR03086 family metal-binding protein [Actinomadura fulvescens]|uniref:TIGR03086 family metal-binding protein n=1 Tax=Actinomadura fulvescens TaxID=46160 RepID=A0ABN3PSX9_9ACTN
MTLDLGPATQRLAGVLVNVTDNQLTLPTPCPAYTLGDLIEHINGLALAFTVAAAKDVPPGGSRGPSGDATRLPAGWRESIPERLAALAQAWRKPDAWEGMTRAGGIDLPGQVAGLVALNEVVVHGWDVARSAGQPYESTPEAVEACLAFLSQEPGGDEDVDGNADTGDRPFGPPVDVPADAPALDRLIGLTGRDPAWHAL